MFQNPALAGVFRYSRLQNVRKLAEMSNSSALAGNADSVTLLENLKVIQCRIEKAVNEAKNGAYWRGQRPSLVAVSKTKSPAAIQCCYGAGQLKFGENYIQELVEKANILKSKCPKIQWHFIGTVQSNKIAKLAEIDNLDCIETMCSKKHCSILEKELTRRNRKLNVLIQVNTSKEDNKSGTTPETALELAKFIRMNCPSLKFSGFMTIGSVEHSLSDTPNEDFEELFRVRKKFCDITNENEINFELSMGMSEDFERAIIQGSTSVRIGNAIFGPRLQPFGH